MAAPPETLAKGVKMVGCVLEKLLIGEPFGGSFTEGQVEKWANKIKHRHPESTFVGIQKKIENQTRFSCLLDKQGCSKAETRLKQCLDSKHGHQNPTNSDCDAEILFLSECLKRPGRCPGTNPDII